MKKQPINKVAQTHNYVTIHYMSTYVYHVKLIIVHTQINMHSNVLYQ